VIKFDDEDTICLTFDVEWASPTVISAVAEDLDKRGLSATFFCTHAGIEVPGHERAIHPNFRRDGDTIRKIRSEKSVEFTENSDDAVFQRIIEETMHFCPEAKGVRTHSLFFELKLLNIMKSAGLEYDSSYLLPFQKQLQPFFTMSNILEIPIYYMDHLDLTNELTNFDHHELRLDQKGLKVFNFHPTLIFINAVSDNHYQSVKEHYADVDALRARRNKRKGIGTLFEELLDEISRRRIITKKIGDISDSFRD
jgi:hypothetical protein